MTTATDLLHDAADDLLMMSAQEKRRWMKRAYQDFHEWFGENVEVLWVFAPETPVGKCLGSMCRQWIRETKDGATYFENWQNDRRNAA